MTSMNVFCRWTWLRLLAAALLLGLAAGQAGASTTITLVQVNGGASTNVAPGGTVTVSVTVVLTNGSRWRSTQFSTSPTSTIATCFLAPDINVNGTFTRTFTLSAPTAPGTYSLNVTAWTNPNCVGTPSPVSTLPGAINTGPVVLTLNHVRIQHDGSALTCSPEPVSLKACANAACTTLFTSNVTVTLGAAAGAWSANPVTLVNGTASVTLSNSTAGTVTLAGTVNSPAAANPSAVCYNGSTGGDCALMFSNAACSLDAVEPAKGPNTPIYTKRIGGPLSLDVLALNNGVINPASNATINATLVTGTGTGCSTTALSPTVTFTLTGTNAGRRNVTFVPSAAARNVRVRMVSGSLIGCSSDNFAIRPSTLTLSAAGAGADATGASVSATPVLKAGSGTFSLSAAATAGYDGAPVINQNLVQSSGAYAGTVAGAFSAASAASSWAAQGSAFTYSEVGYFSLKQFAVYDDVFADIDRAKVPSDCLVDANLGTATAPADPNITAADGRLGCYFGSAATSYLGRFIPDRFVLGSPAVTNRSALVGCTSAFTYMDEPMEQTFTLMAKNALGDPTANYVGSFARINLATQLGMGAINDPAIGTRTPFPACGATPAHPCYTAGTVSGTFAFGSADVIVPLTVYRGVTAVGPYPNFKFGLAPVDPDGVKIAAYDLDTTNVVAGAANHATAASTELRYGRLSIDNAYGSELLNLSAKLSAQYWKGSSWATNTLDSCTQPAFSAFAAADYKGGITTTNMPFTKLSAGAPLLVGAGKLLLAKPGAPLPASKGSVTLRSSLIYLPGNARATFGIYKAGPVIYVRETY